MNRQYPISDAQILLIRSELMHLKRNCIITPDTDASYQSILNVLKDVKGA